MKRFLSLLMGLALFLAGCGPSESQISTSIAQTAEAQPTETLTSTPAPTNTPMPTFTPRRHKVEYIVEGSQIWHDDLIYLYCYIRYRDGHGNENQCTAGGTSGKCDMPFDKTYTMYDGDLAFVSATIKTDCDTCVTTCEIKIDGRSWKSASAVGTDSTATCQGIIGQD